jgi:hypothetical protein
MQAVLQRMPMDDWQRMSPRQRRQYLRQTRLHPNVVNDVFPPGGIASDTNRSLSPAIWGKMPKMAECAVDPTIGQFWFDDFRDFPFIGTQTTEIAHGRYKVFNTGSGVVTRAMAVNSVTLQGGALENGLDTDNDSGSIAQSYPSFRLSGSPANSGLLAFECCYAQSSVATNMAAGFVGLAETNLWTLATGVPFNGGDAITNGAAAIGFRIEEDGLGVVDTVYSDRATSFTNIGDTEGGTLVAYTFKKFGLLYDPTNKDDCIRFFSDGVELASNVARSTLTGLTNLDANLVGLILANCADSAGTSFKSFMKWWSVMQLFV